MRKNVPRMFMLKCCFEEGCVHPVCKEGRYQNKIWYPGGPSIAFLPLPFADPDRPFECNSCSECANDCSGHYMEFNRHTLLYLKHTTCLRQFHLIQFCWKP